MWEPPDDEWLILRYPSEVDPTQSAFFTCHLGRPTDDERAQLIAAARVLVGFPPGDGWVGSDTHSVGLTYGEPHADMLGKARIGSLDELSTVDAAAVAGHIAAGHAENRAAKIAAARAALAELEDHELAQALEGTST